MTPLLSCTRYPETDNVTNAVFVVCGFLKMCPNKIGFFSCFWEGWINSEINQSIPDSASGSKIFVMESTNQSRVWEKLRKRWVEGAPSSLSLLSVLSLFPPDNDIITWGSRLTVHMMSAPRQACRWRCYHEHCLAATEAAAAPRHHLYTALRRDTARVRSLLSRGDAALSDAQEAATRRKSVENWMAVGQASSNHHWLLDIQIVVLVKVLRVCVCTINENWSRLK